MTDTSNAVDANVPAIPPSMPESQPAIPQRLVELHGWGRAASSMSHLASIDSLADAVSALRTSGGRGVTPRPPSEVRRAETASARESIWARRDIDEAVLPQPCSSTSRCGMAGWDSGVEGRIAGTFGSVAGKSFT